MDNPVHALLTGNFLGCLAWAVLLVPLACPLFGIGYDVAVRVVAVALQGRRGHPGD